MRQHHRVKDGAKGRSKKALAWTNGKKILQELIKTAERPITKRKVRFLFVEARKIARRGA